MVLWIVEPCRAWYTVRVNQRVDRTKGAEDGVDYAVVVGGVVNLITRTQLLHVLQAWKRFLEVIHDKVAEYFEEFEFDLPEDGEAECRDQAIFCRVYW